MEAIHSVRIDHGAVPPNNGMAYSQRSQSVHRPNPSGGDTGPPHKQARTILSPPSSGAGLVSAHGVSAGAGAYHGYRYMPGPYTAYAPPAAPYRPTEYHPPAQRQIPDRQQQERQAAQDNVNRNIQNHRSLQESNRSLQEQQHRSLAEHHRNIAEQQHRGLQSEYIRQSTAQPTQQQQQQQQEHVRAAQTPQDHIREHLRNVSQQSRVFSPQDHQSPHQQQQQQSHQQQRNVSDHIRSIPPDHLRNQQEVLRIDGITHEQLNQSQMRPRISLLPPSAEYLSNMAPRRDMYRPPDQGMVQDLVTSHGGQMQIDMSSGQPFKKIRLGEQKVDMQPLRIDTRESTGSYNPQVEAISPTPNDHGQDDHAFRTTKDGLLQNIGRVDREIAKVESSIQKLKKKQQELEEAASKPAIKQEVEEVSQPKHQCQAQKIYAVNRKKAATAHSSLDSLGPKVEWPLYNQPSDAQVYHDNKRRHKSFKKKLLEYFKKRHAEKELREQYLTQTYSKLMQEWLRKVEKIESSQKRKAKEAKNREFFEKVFPELRKQREDKERFNRVGARIKSEADLEEIMDGLQEQELEDKKMRSYAVIPPILLDARQRKLCYANNNGHISDMESEHKERQLINVWINSEREIFKEKYLQHPKNFGLISSFLDRKSVQDCVQHYYLTKKTENYKQLLRKSRQRTRSSRNNPQKVNNAANNSIVDILTTGVTTRLQREQQQKTTVSAPHTAESTNNSQTTSTTSAGVTNSDECKSQSNKSPVSTTAQSTTVVQPAASTSPSTSVITTSLTTAVAPTTCVTAPVVSNIVTHQSAPPTVNNGASSDNLTVIANHDGQDTEKIVTSDHSSGATGNSTLEKKKKDRRKDKEKDVSMETSDEETTDVQEKGSGPHNCAVCKTELEQFTQSRPLPTTHASQYGLRADQVPAGARVCNTCRCKCIRTRYTHCPLPTCGSANAAGGANAATGANSGNSGAPNVAVSTASGATTPNTGSHSRAGRVKRLRTMPPRWATELPRDVWTAVVHEFQIPQGVTKCCSACYNRISRRLAPHLPPSSSSAGSPGAAWGEDERTKLRTLLAEHGAHWSLISEKIGRPVHQVKNFYLDQRKRLGLDMIVAEYNRTHHGDERKPVLTDEEESGSTTSSCEEIAEIIPRDRLSSDTTSANSPPETTGLSQTEGRPAKPDYDSSATETADEGQTAEEQRQNYSNQATITVVNGPNQGSRANDNVSPMTVKDLMLNVIERQLKKTPGVNSTMMPSGVSNLSGITPTISSILKSQEGQDIKFVREYKPRAQDNSSLATLSVVNSHGGHGPPAQQQQQQQQMSNMQSQQPPQLMPNVGQIAATITPIPTPQPMQLTQQSQSQQAELPREGLVVMQVQQALREREPETLDLSIKRPRDPNPPMPKMQHPLYRPPPEQYYHSKSPSVYVLATPRPKPPTPAPSPKPANPKSGSITQGTPVINQQTNVQRYDGLLRQTPPPKMGSITQGTPIHLPTHMQDKQRAYDYYAKRQSPVANYRQPSYTMEQQLSSRQIIMNDYITSQQMQHPPPRRSEKSQESPRGVVTSSPLYYEGQYVARTPPPPQRQGVIQRHRPSPPPPPRRSYAPLPGHEAFSSLVDVAVQQPQLPVPHKENHEGLGKTIADQTQRYNQQIALQHQRQRIADFNRQQMYREQMRIQQPQPPQDAPPTQQVQRSQQESSTLTAASLIDAIITHQINQSAENNAGPKENVPNIRAGDRLFQAFHTPASTIENNGSHSPGVINVDLESDGPKLTVKEFADSVINRDFGGRQAYYQHKPQPDERTIIRVAQQQKAYHASPPRSYNQPHTHMFDYVKNRIVEVMRTEDEQKETDKSDSPGEMVIDESKRDSVTPPTFTPHFAYPYNALNVGGQHVVNTNQKNEMGQNETNRQSEPKQIMSAQYEPLSDED